MGVVEVLEDVEEIFVVALPRSATGLLVLRFTSGGIRA